MVFLFGTLGSFLNFAYRRKNILTALVPDQDDPRLEPNKIENIFFFSLTETSKKLSDFIQDHFSLVAGSIFVSSVYMFFHCWDMKCDLNYGLTKDAEVEVLGVKGKLVDGPCCGQCTRSEIPKVKFSKSVEPPSESELTWDTVKIAPNGRKDIIGRGGFCGSISCCKMGSLCCRDSNGLKCVGWVCPSAISGVSPFSARGRRFVHQRLFRLIFGFGRFCGVGSVGDKEKEEVQINYDQSWKDFAKTTPEFRIGLGAFIFMFCVALFDLFIVLFERESESQLQTRTSKCTCFFGLEVDTVDKIASASVLIFIGLGMMNMLVAKELAACKMATSVGALGFGTITNLMMSNFCKGLRLGFSVVKVGNGKLEDSLSFFFASEAVLIMGGIITAVVFKWAEVDFKPNNKEEIAGHFLLLLIENSFKMFFFGVALICYNETNCFYSRARGHNGNFMYNKLTKLSNHWLLAFGMFTHGALDLFQFSVTTMVKLVGKINDFQKVRASKKGMNETEGSEGHSKKTLAATLGSCRGTDGWANLCLDMEDWFYRGVAMPLFRTEAERTFKLLAERCDVMENYVSTSAI